MTRHSPALYRTALDLVTARQRDEYEVFTEVLDELTVEYAGLGVLGVFAVTNLSVRQASVIGQCPASRVLGGLHVEPVPAAQPVVPAVLTLLYTALEDLAEASSIARDLGAGDDAEPAMVVLADVSIAMAERLTAFSGLPAPQVIASWRQQVEHRLADDTWAA
ncbi:hypothetical protein GB931_17470 [Modestobacter sp. I12A-02628]|uniref:Uncharacterized protein n=1 Tax=Goekera deserti TaxID=2497753 RepID=A0A7K3WE97_9ACTN|nr:hypothetical protein [Goekera deserti]MPQ99676.1 hypothetical protein [Goekera deserti]NDI46314.1 hypothetical protein [Goekera deserti]NEL54754.1 hypothetical protein [Goekera deserti]